MKIKIQKIRDYFDGFQLREDMENFLESLRKNKRLGALFKGSQIKFEIWKGDLWLGAYGKDIQGFWFGFQMHQSPPEIYVHAQRAFVGDKRTLFEKLKTHSVWGSQLYPEEEGVGGCFVQKEEKSWIRFRKRLTEDFCADDKMREWFLAIAEFVRDLNEAK